jgi:hypothetical protein
MVILPIKPVTKTFILASSALVWPNTLLKGSNTTAQSGITLLIIRVEKYFFIFLI